MPGEEVYLSVFFIMPQSPAKVEVYYPGSATPVLVTGSNLEVSMGTYSWVWLVPADIPSGEGRVVVTAVPGARSIIDTKTFQVLAQGQTSAPIKTPVPTVTPTLAPEHQRCINRALSVCILSMSSKVIPRGEANLSVMFALPPPEVAEVTVWAYYPGGGNPVPVAQRRAWFIGVHFWDWVVPANVLSGEARIEVTAVFGRDVQRDSEAFIVEAQESSP